MTLDIIGTLHDISGDPEQPTVTALDGYHVNSSEPVPVWEAHLVVPTNPKRVFAGADTFFYRFPSESVWLECAQEL